MEQHMHYGAPKINKETFVRLQQPNESTLGAANLCACADH